MYCKTSLIALGRWTLGAVLAVCMAHAYADQGRRGEDELLAQQRRAALRATLQGQRDESSRRRSGDTSGGAADLQGRQLSKQEREELRQQLRQQRRNGLPETP